MAPVLKVAVQISLLFGLAGCAGLIAHGVSTVAPLIYLYNHYVSCWFTGFLVFGSLQTMYFSWLSSMGTGGHTGNIVHAAWVLVASVIGTVGYALSPQIDTATWSALTVWVHATNLAIIIQARKEKDVLKDSLLPSFLSTSISHCPKWLTITNATARVIHGLLWIGLAAGAIVAAYTGLLIAPKYTVETVTLTDGRTQHLQVKCSGPVTDNLPTFWFDSSDAHGIGDFLGVQYYLNQLGRRACIYDRPSFGGSDLCFVDQKSSMTYYKSLLEESGENLPVIMVGWGGGGEDALQVATDPTTASYVRAVVFLEVSADGIEWRAARNISTTPITDAQYAENRRTDLLGRIALTNLILGLALPWGLIPIFFPYNSQYYYPPSQYEYFHALPMTSKMWSKQKSALIDFVNSVDSGLLLESQPLPYSQPLIHIMGNRSDEMICQGQNWTEDYCTSQVLSFHYMLSERIAMTKAIQSNATFSFCTDLLCDLGFPVDLAEYTANTIVNTAGNITRI